jgi:ubiquinone/menaquinone biosynthesis C-methylase UbiE
VTPAPVAGVFGDGETHVHEQHRLLESAYDRITTERLAESGVGPPWRCLEVGAGNGSVAVWLRHRTTHVLATDINPVAPNVMRHDIAGDPLPEAEFDLIHARLVLRLLPDRAAVLDRLVRALRPGGILQLDEFDAARAPALRVPSPSAGELYETFTQAKNRVMTAAGVAVSWGREVPHAMSRAGLVDITTRTDIEIWQAASPGLRLLAHHTRHLRAHLLRSGLSDRQLAQVRALLADPVFRARSYVFYSVQGHRPREIR